MHVPTTPAGTITTVAGNGTIGAGGDGGPATVAQLNRPYGLCFGPDGSLYIADHFNSRVRRVAPDGTISTVAGTGGPPWQDGGDGGPATAARLDQPVGLAAGLDGSLYVADSANDRVRRVGPDGTISTVAGTGAPGDGGDGGRPPRPTSSTHVM